MTRRAPTNPNPHYTRRPYRENSRLETAIGYVIWSGVPALMVLLIGSQIGKAVAG